MVSLFRAQLPQLRRLRPGRLGSKQRLGRPKASCACMEHSEEGHLFFWSVAHFPNKTGFISWHNHQKVVYKSGSPSKRPLGVSIYSRNHVKALHAPQKKLWFFIQMSRHRSHLSPPFQPLKDRTQRTPRCQRRGRSKPRCRRCP